MCATIHLLIVEDDSHQYETYNDTAEELKKNDGSPLFELTLKTTLLEAKTALLSNDFDAAVVDINLDERDPSEASGNEILETIIGMHRFPVFVVSGNLSMLTEEIRNKESSFLRFYNRDESNDKIFNEIKKICRTGITQILGGRGLIEKKLTEIFWSHLAKDLDVWFENGQSSEKSLLRYTISHLSEYLEDEDNFSDAEFYIKPPIRTHIAAGDIAEKNGVKFIMLSPACDIAVRNADSDGNPVINANRLVIAKLIKVRRSDFIANYIIKEDDNAKRRETALDRIIKGQHGKYIFLPPYKELDASIIDLQNLHTIKFNEYILDYKRIATVSGLFLKNIQSRFSSYYGRQGQPNLSQSELLKKLKNYLSDNE